MELIDAQLHAHPPYPPPATPDMHPGQLAHGDHVTVEDLLTMMKAVGVDACVLVHPSAYGLDLTYPQQAVADHPGKFGVVAAVTPSTPDAVDRVRTWRDQPGMLAVRVVILTDAHRQLLEAGAYEPIFSAAESAAVPVFIFPPRLVGSIHTIARAHPDLQLIVDHLGIAQPPVMVPDPDPFQTLPDLLTLAQYENVAVKCTGVPSVSNDPYPFADLWPHLHGVFEAFGADRIMWGSDISRVDNHTYLHAVSYMLHTDEISGAEKELVMGRTLCRILRWERAAPG